MLEDHPLEDPGPLPVYHATVWGTIVKHTPPRGMGSETGTLIPSHPHR